MRFVMNDLMVALVSERRTIIMCYHHSYSLTWVDVGDKIAFAPDPYAPVGRPQTAAAAVPEPFMGARPQTAPQQPANNIWGMFR